jgi:hypothetical protein
MDQPHRQVAPSAAKISRVCAFIRCGSKKERVHFSSCKNSKLNRGWPINSPFATRVSVLPMLDGSHMSGTKRGETA